MSGVGKSYLSLQLAEWGWHHYSCDLEIGTRFLGDHIEGEVRAEDLSALSRFIGKVGELPLEEFKRRQKLYYNAEIAALKDVAQKADKYKKFVNDSTGSLCEILDEDVLREVGEATLFVYIKASKKEEAEILRRAEEYPKPLFYPPRQFDAWLHEYQQLFDAPNPDQIDADEYARWVFPRLFETRLPKYERLAEMYGVIVSSKEVHGVRSEDDFLNLIAKALP